MRQPAKHDGATAISVRGSNNRPLFSTALGKLYVGASEHISRAQSARRLKAK